jgi:hypothetical protein
MLSPRAIALQGLGFSVAFVALQGLVPLSNSNRGIDTSVGGSHRHQTQGGERLMRQAREEDELLLAILHTVVGEM